MKLLLGVSILLGGIALAPVAQAETVNDVELTSVGVQGTQVYFWFGSNLPGCPARLLYHAVNQTGQFVMSLAVSAKVANRRIVRVDYHYDTNNKACWLDLIEL